IAPLLFFCCAMASRCFKIGLQCQRSTSGHQVMVSRCGGIAEGLDAEVEPVGLYDLVVCRNNFPLLGQIGLRPL
ncbi:hypothetical protein MXD81_27410, partial [Microbacteriaceae bacterium K1510]|nr:hypothetical protein [Microbacteriaceae bacterium K1510]